MKIDDLIPDPNNANKGTRRGKDALQKSLKKYGAGRSVLVDANGTIIAGNKTVEEAREAGIEEVIVVDTTGDTLVAVRRIDLNLEDDPLARELAYADNRISEIDLNWDPEQIQLDIDEGLDLSAIFETDDFKALGVEFEPAELPEAPEPQIERADELQEIWGVESGDLWKIGEHLLVCGDCTDAAVVARLMGGELADCVFTDPPYGVAIGDKNKFLNEFQKAGRVLTNIEGDAMTQEALQIMLTDAFKIVREFIKDSGSVYMTAPQGGDLGLMMLQMMKDAGLPVRHVLNWVKNSPTFSMGRLDYEYQHEPIFYTWKKNHQFYGRGEYKTSTWFIDKPRASKDHPTMKPVELVENALLNSTEKGHLVYEPFAGSGTTLIACERLGRVGRGIEIAPKYCSVILERFKEMGVEPILYED